jgi:BNR repeat-like domain
MECRSIALLVSFRRTISVQTGQIQAIMRLLLSSLLALCAMALTPGMVRAQSDIRVNDDVSTRLQENPSIVVDSEGALVVAWSDRRGGTSNPQVYSSRSTDGGYTWSPNLRVSSQQARPAGGMEMGPNMAASGNTIYINWADIRRTPAWSYVDVCFAWSSDAGKTFTGDPRINNDTMRSQHQPSIAAADSVVYCVWHGFPPSGQLDPTPIFIRRSRDYGRTFDTQRRIDYYDDIPKGISIGSCNCCRPWVMTDGGSSLYVAYRIDSANIRDIFLLRSTDRGETWEPARRVSRGMWNFDACPGSGPAGAVRNDTVFVAWMDQRNAEEAAAVYITRSTDGGRTFGPEIKLDSNANLPSVAFDRSGRVFATWGTNEAKGEIYCSMSTDGGATFGARRRVNGVVPKEMNMGASMVAAPDGSVHVVWQDGRRDGGDIYYSNLSRLMETQSSAEPADAGRSAGVAIHPNPLPAGGELWVELRGTATEASIVDALGRIVTRLDPGLARQTVIMEGSGVYFVIADFGGIRRSTPFVVAR